MAESTLSLTYADLMNSVSYFLHGKDDYTDLDATQQAKCDQIVQDGYRQFLYPPMLDGIDVGYEWRFMNPNTTMSTIATYETGTVAVVAGVCTITGGTWPSWSFTHGTLTIGGTEYVITARTSDADLAVTGAAVAAGEDDWTLEHDGNYDLPDDFGRLIDGFSFEPGSVYVGIMADVGEGQIRLLRAGSEMSGRPTVAGTRIKAGTGIAGQRREVMFYPTPDEVYVLYYRYAAMVNKLDTTNVYPLGAMKHSETLKLSCLAKADALVNDNYGIHWERFLQSVKASIARDKREEGVFFGDVGPGNQYKDTPGGGVLGYSLTVGGVRIE